jgi:hypothetical protein
MHVGTLFLLNALCCNSLTGQAASDIDPDSLGVDSFKHEYIQNPKGNSLEIIRNAYETMLSERTLVSNEGCVISYSHVVSTGPQSFSITYHQKFASGKFADGKEVISTSNLGVIVDQYTDGIWARQYAATLEEPYDVLRIRPLQQAGTRFLSRECLRRNMVEGTRCFIKVRYGDDVAVTTFSELRPTPN